MLMSTELLSSDERAAALAVVPWRDDILKLNGQIFGTLANQSIDLIDTAIGPSHVRPALVALYEAADLLVEGTIELSESVASEKYLHRTTPMDPLGLELLTEPLSIARIPWRFSRYAVESAGTHVITAGDHLANCHVRLAWEANAAIDAEMKLCRFDPSEPEPKSWISAVDLEVGLRKASKSGLSVFPGFEAIDSFHDFMQSSVKAREYRHAVIHRDRPNYSELPSFGRTTLWTQQQISLTFPQAPVTDAPPMAFYRDLVAEAMKSATTYAWALWDLAIRWLRTLDVQIDMVSPGVRIATSQGIRAIAREKRDPGSFIAR
jgi:hypothetical protein